MSSRVARAAVSPVARSELRIAVVDDHVLFAEALEIVLSVEGYDVRRVDIPPDEHSPRAFLRHLLRVEPQIVLLDLDLGMYGDGIQLIRPLVVSGASVVVVTASLDKARWGEALHNGARTVLAKGRPISTILAAVRRINNDLPVIEQAEREHLMRCWQEQRAEFGSLRSRLDLLSAREAQVLTNLMRGRSVREIASASVVSEATVRTQVKSILAKLEVSSQLAAVGLAYQVGWQPTTPT